MHTREVVEEMFGEHVHLAVVRSIANGVCGALNAVMASVAAIGRAYAELAGIREKSGIKQVDRLLSNDGVVLSEVMALWIRYVVGQTPSIVVAIDWTDFDDDDHTTLCVSMMTAHGRATPLAWKTVKKSSSESAHAPRAADGEGLATLVARARERGMAWREGFGYRELYELLASYGWHYTIRFRENIKVYERGDAICLPASACVPRTDACVRS